MANVRTLSDPNTFLLDTTGTVNIGDAGSRPGAAFIVQISGTFVGSLTFRKKARNSSVADASAGAASYSNPLTDPFEVTALTAALTAAGMAKIYVEGCALILSYTATSGTVVVECVPVFD